MLTYFTNLFLLLLAGGIVINGWFAVTRGQWKDEVDGTRTKEGALLKAWWFFWFKEYDEPKLIQYKGDDFMKLLDTIEGQKKFNTLGISDCNNNEVSAHFTIESPHNRMLFKTYFGVSMITKQMDVGMMRDRRMVRFYKEEPRYRFPEWIRTMMAGCITCFSSFYGSIFFWVSYILIGRDWFAGITEYPEALLICTWIAYMLGLAYVNTYLWKRTNK